MLVQFEGGHLDCVHLQPFSFITGDDKLQLFLSVLQSGRTAALDIFSECRDFIKPFHFIFKIFNFFVPCVTTFFSRNSFPVKFANVVWDASEDIKYILNRLWCHFSRPQWVGIILIQVRSHDFYYSEQLACALLTLDCWLPKLKSKGPGHGLGEWIPSFVGV